MSAAGRALPNAARRLAFIEDELAIRGLNGPAASLPRDLDRVAPVSGHLPHLPGSCPVGAEIDEPPVSRIARKSIVRSVPRQTPLRAAGGIDGVEFELTLDVGVEDDLFAIRRPVWAAGHAGAKRCQLNGV